MPERIISSCPFDESHTCQACTGKRFCEDIVAAKNVMIAARNRPLQQRADKIIEKTFTRMGRKGPLLGVFQLRGLADSINQLNASPPETDFPDIDDSPRNFISSRFGHRGSRGYR